MRRVSLCLELYVCVHVELAGPEISHMYVSAATVHMLMHVGMPGVEKQSEVNV